MKRKKSILAHNFRLSIGFGFAMGILFPLYALVFVDFKSPLMAVFFIVGCLLAGFLVGIAGYIINTRPIIHLAHNINTAITDVRSGTPVDDTEFIHSADILGEMVKNFFDGMLLLRKSLDAVSKTADNAIGVGGDIEKSLASTVESTEVLFDTIDLISGAADELDEHNSIMDKGFDSLSKAILLNVSNIIELYTNVSEFGETIYRQTESLEQVITSLKEIERAVGSDNTLSDQTLSGLETQLGHRVRETIDTSLSVFSAVKERLSDIDGIAERTNVLSINAAIEAARLGAQGGGFRIIASNIKALAEEVHSLTGRITLEMNGGEQSLRSVTGYLNEALDSQSGIIEGIRASITSLSERNSLLSTRMLAMEENRLHIDNLLKDIKENMQNLKQQVAATRESLTVLLNTSVVIQSGIGTLSDKAVGILENGKTVSGSFEHFKNGLAGITL